MEDEVRFRVLGPLTVLRAGKTVPVPGRIAPRLLAVLLLAAGRPVSSQRLTAGVWDEDPPATARRQLQNTVNALRRRFGSGVIASAGDGYRVDLDHCEVDVVDFADAIVRAREQSASGNTGAAVRSLRSALDLWFGRPLSGLPGRIIDAAVGRLVESRYAAVEDVGECELALGEAVTVTDALREQLRESPHRQRTVARLMMALHQSGRTAEALTVFNDFQARMTEDLGLDPDAELMRLHTMLLRGDPMTSGSGTEITGDDVSPTRQRSPIPAQLPSDPAVFVGRTEQQSVLTGQHGDPHAARACLITGAAGSGKTALAVHWAHGVRHQFPDGQIYLNLRGFDPGEPMAELEALGRCIRALQAEGLGVPSDRDAAVNLFHSLLDRKRVLLVLDNARDAGQVRALLPGAPAFAVITSRNRQPDLVAQDAVVPIGLDPLAQSESIGLLSEVISTSRLSAEVGAAYDIAERCGHLPLALRIAAAHLAVNPDLPILDYAVQLTRHDRLDSLVIDDDPDAAVAVSLDHSFRALDSEAQELVCQLGTVPGHDFSQAMLAATFEKQESDLRPVLDRLVDSHVLEQHRAGRYRFHDLVREYAAKRAKSFVSDDERGAIHHRFIEWHYPRSTEYDQDEEVNIITAARKLSDHPRLWKLVSPLVRAISAGNHDEQILTLIDAGLANAKHHGDKHGECFMLSLRATFTYVIESFDESVTLAYKAVELAGQLDDATLGIVKNSLAVRLQFLGRTREAEKQYLDALLLTPPDVTKNRLFIMRVNLCNLYIDLGRYDDARTLLTRACREHRTRDGVQFQFRSRSIESRLALQVGDYDTVTEIVDELVDIAVSSKIQTYICGAFLCRGELRRLTQQYEPAYRDLALALESAYALQRAASECTALTELALLQSERGSHESALEFVAALMAQRYEDIQIPFYRASIEQTLCTVKLGVGEYRESISFGKSAVERFASMPYPLLQARTLATLAEAHHRLGERGRAHALRSRAFAIFSHIGVSSFGLPALLTRGMATKKRS